VAFEHDLLGHGLLTWAIVQALTKEEKKADAFNADRRPNGTITLQELITYAKKVAYAKKEELKEDNLEGIERQEIEFSIVMLNDEITGWPLMKIPLSFDIDPLLEMLEDLRNKGLTRQTYNVLRKYLEDAKKQVFETGKIAANNCMGKQVFSFLNQSRVVANKSGGVDPNEITAIQDTLQEELKLAKARCKKRPE
jgi:hypothetical protein